MRTWWLRFGLVRAVVADLRLAARLARDPLVPWVVKALPILAVFYVLAPIDLVPDLLPVLGQADDLGVLVLGLKLFVRVCPAACVAFHRDQIQQRRPYSAAPSNHDVLDAQFRRL
jgi:uncharacterized membrane protein YkvA (DUF1232 family)